MEKQFDAVALGARIKQYRELRKLSQESLAERSGLHQTYISYLELAKERSVSLDSLSKVATALEVGIDQLLVDSLDAYDDKVIAADKKHLITSLNDCDDKQLNFFYELAQVYLSKDTEIK